MSERHHHQAAAAVNYALAVDLVNRGGDAACWVPTLAFYTAVQILDCRIADDNEHPNSQFDRMTIARSRCNSSAGPTAYKNLKDLSEDWRYDGKRPRQDQLTAVFRWAETLANTLGEPWPPQ